MKSDPFKKLCKLLDRLEESGIYYEIRRYRDEGVSVDIAVPGQRWEVDFLEDGTIDVERFTSTGDVLDEKSLDEMLSEFPEQTSPRKHRKVLA